MRLVFLGKLGDAAPDELAEIARPQGVETLADLKDWLARAQPMLSRRMAATPVRLIVNQAVAHDMRQALGDHDEIAFLPPMSGG
jgi:molybdopterin converting factor small subunit